MRKNSDRAFDFFWPPGAQCGSLLQFACSTRRRAAAEATGNKSYFCHPGKLEERNINRASRVVTQLKHKYAEYTGAPLSRQDRCQPSLALTAKIPQHRSHCSSNLTRFFFSVKDFGLKVQCFYLFIYLLREHVS